MKKNGNKKEKGEKKGKKQEKGEPEQESKTFKVPSWCPVRSQFSNRGNWHLSSFVHVHSLHALDAWSIYASEERQGHSSIKRFVYALHTSPVELMHQDIGIYVDVCDRLNEYLQQDPRAPVSTKKMYSKYVVKYFHYVYANKVWAVGRPVATTHLWDRFITSFYDNEVRLDERHVSYTKLETAKKALENVRAWEEARSSDPACKVMCMTPLSTTTTYKGLLRQAKKVDVERKVEGPGSRIVAAKPVTVTSAQYHRLAEWFLEWKGLTKWQILVRLRTRADFLAVTTGVCRSERTRDQLLSRMFLLELVHLRGVMTVESLCMFGVKDKTNQLGGHTTVNCTHAPVVSQHSPIVR